MMIDNDTKNTGQVELETDFNKNKNISTTKFPTISFTISLGNTVQIFWRMLK